MKNINLNIVQNYANYVVNFLQDQLLTVNKVDEFKESVELIIKQSCLFCFCEQSSVIVSFIFLKRYFKTYNCKITYNKIKDFEKDVNYQNTLFILQNDVFNIICACFLLAIKFLSDTRFTLSYFLNFLKLDTSEFIFTEYELDVFKNLDLDLRVDENEYNENLNYLLQYVSLN